MKMYGGAEVRRICFQKMKYSFVRLMETEFLVCRLEVFAVVKLQVEVFWLITPCSFAVGKQRFGGPCCPHLQGEVNDTEDGDRVAEV